MTSEEVRNSDLLEGNKFYIQNARKALPYLVRQAKAGEPIYYSDLAAEIGIPNPRNLNYILGFIGNSLFKLSKRTKVKIPQIQSLVISKKEDLPGKGIWSFINVNNPRNLTINQKKQIIQKQLTHISTFPDWDWVLHEFNLQPIKSNIEDELNKAKKYRYGGESEHHKRFKKFISENPQVLGLSKVLGDGELEYKLPSGDSIDVLFISKKLKIGVEVKSKISGNEDILRGLFQCIKYKHLIEAEQIVKDEYPNCRVILALQGALPPKFILEKNLLGIEVIDNIIYKD